MLKRHIYTVYKRITSELVTQQTETEGIKQMVFYTNETKKKLWVAILTAEKINFKAKTELRDKEGQNSDTGINPRRTYNIHKYVCMYVCMYVSNIGIPNVKENVNKYKGRYCQ